MNELVKLAKEHLGKRQYAQWDSLREWRALTASTSGIEGKSDPRYEKVMHWIDVATTAELLGSWSGFREAAEQIRDIMRGGA